MSPNPVPRCNVLGVGIAAVNRQSASDAILAAARSRSQLSVSALAVHAVMEAQGDPEYRRRLNALDLALPDGQPVRWALNLSSKAALRDRVYGPFLMRHLCAAAAAEGLPIFLFGSTEATLARLSTALNVQHPGLVVAGTRASRFRRVSEAEARADAADIQRSGAQIVFCGLGCPRQESWVHAMRPLVQAPLVAVGAAFALWAGERSMAPSWMQASGLEWLYRLAQEPRRLAGRYLVQNPRFALRVMRQVAGGHRDAVTDEPAKPEYWG
jgi:exopolysaccharide biosynthesis WecB/TagA/CpsF family protein